MQDLQLTKEQKVTAFGHALTCAKQEGVTKEEALDLSVGKFDNVTNKGKCYAKCLLERIGFLTNGKVQPDDVIYILGTMFPLSKIKSVLAKCGSIKGRDRCDTGFLLYKCYYEGLSL